MIFNTYTDSQTTLQKLLQGTESVVIYIKKYFKTEQGFILQELK
jgi:hypothetical protein